MIELDMIGRYCQGRIACWGGEDWGVDSRKVLIRAGDCFKMLLGDIQSVDNIKK